MGTTRRWQQTATNIAAWIATFAAVATWGIAGVEAQRDRGVNQPGAAGNRGGVDPGINQPGAAGNRVAPPSPPPLPLVTVGRRDRSAPSAIPGSTSRGLPAMWAEIPGAISPGPRATADKRQRRARFLSVRGVRRSQLMTSFAQLLDPIPVTLVFVGFMIVAIIASEIGFRIGRWWQRRSPGEQEGPTEMLVGSILTMLAFLLAVTMGMASDRFDARHGLVRDEANTIRTTFLRAGYLAEPYGKDIQNLLREYVPLRVVSRATPSSRPKRAVEKDPCRPLDADEGTYPPNP